MEMEGVKNNCYGQCEREGMMFVEMHKWGEKDGKGYGGESH